MFLYSPQNAVQLFSLPFWLRMGKAYAKRILQTAPHTFTEETSALPEMAVEISFSDKLRDLQGCIHDDGRSFAPGCEGRSA